MPVGGRNGDRRRIRSRAPTEEENRANREDETKHYCRDQQWAKLRVLATLHDEDVVEIMKLVP
ncbi:hypothetical protein XH96_03525 [Bradyrhizobium sp. CCBAU 51765]|nr:hypothetical protein XH96_03525 [Bradyrhizobium sp. CCBAU 51765]